MDEAIPLSTLHDAILDFLRGRDDAVLCGAHAVNAYVAEPRMTQDIDIVAIRAADIAEELCAELRERFHIAVRIRKIKGGKGFRLYQVQKPRNRHLADIRTVQELPPARRISRIQVMAPADLIAGKVIAYCQRRGKPKSGTDWRDIAMLLLTFPELKQASGEVFDRLHGLSREPVVFAVWQQFVGQDIDASNDDDEDW